MGRAVHARGVARPGSEEAGVCVRVRRGAREEQVSAQGTQHRAQRRWRGRCASGRGRRGRGAPRSLRGRAVPPARCTRRACQSGRGGRGPPRAKPPGAALPGRTQGLRASHLDEEHECGHRGAAARPAGLRRTHAHAPPRCSARARPARPTGRGAAGEGALPHGLRRRSLSLPCAQHAVDLWR